MEGTELEPVVKATQEEIKEGTARAFVSPSAKATAPAKVDKNAAPQQAPAAPAQSSAAPVIETAPVETPAAKSKINLEDLSEEDQNELIARLTKGKVKSVKELTEEKIEDTPAQKEEKAKVKKQQALQHALATGKIKQEDYDNAILVKGKNNRDIALELFAKDAREDNPKLTDSEVDELFTEYYMEAADDDDLRRKLRSKEMNRTADNYRNSVTKNVDGIETDYDIFQTREQKLATYGKLVDNIFDNLLQKDRVVKFPYIGPGNTEVEVEIPYSLDESDIKTLKRNIRNINAFNALEGDKRDLKDKDIMGAVEYDLAASILPKVLTAVAAKAAEKGKMDAEAFFKAIPKRTPESIGASEQGDVKKRPLITQEMRDRFPKGNFRN